MMSNYRLEGLENFCYRELDTAADLLRAVSDGKLPQWFDDRGLAIEFNPNSGYVFLTNDDYQVLMLSGSSLIGWHFLSYSGEEGTTDDLWWTYEMGDICNEDLEQLADIFEMEGEHEHADTVRDYLLTIQE